MTNTTMQPIDFIMSIEDGSLTNDQFFDNVQDFVDSGIWKSLQGSWQRMVYTWEQSGYCTIK